MPVPNYKFLLFILLAWRLVCSCQMVRDSGGGDGKKRELPFQPISESEPAQPSCDKNLSQGGRTLSGPVIMVHAWGTNLLVSMNRFAGFLEQEGIDKADIYEPSYPYLLSLERMKERLLEQLNEIDAGYPKSTQYTFVTHSLGQFVALYTIMGTDWAKRVKKFISLGGFAYGQNRKPALCLGNVCGPIWSQIVPFKNDFLIEFFNKHKSQLAALDKCSLSSATDDKIDAPPRAGDFEDGVNVLIEGEFTHRDLVRERKVFDKMVSACFKQIKKPRCPARPESDEDASADP